MFNHHNYNGYSDYNSWKDNLTADIWVSYPDSRLDTPVYGRIAEHQDDDGETYYEREFKYGSSFIDELDLDVIIRRSIRIPAVRISSPENLSIFDMPAA